MRQSRATVLFAIRVCRATVHTRTMHVTNVKAHYRAAAASASTKRSSSAGVV